MRGDAATVRWMKPITQQPEIRRDAVHALRTVSAEPNLMLKAAGGRAIFVSTDVTVEAEAAWLVRAAITEFGRLDGAFNNAGGVYVTGPVHA